jgi:hypothetical protein
LQVPKIEDIEKMEFPKEFIVTIQFLCMEREDDSAASRRRII